MKRVAAQVPAGPLIAPLTSEQLTAALATRVLGWTVAPERFLIGNRGWMPRWHFQPLTKLDDAFRLLDAAATGFTLVWSADQTFTARVQIGNRRGSAKGDSKPAVITVAIARAVGLDVPDRAPDYQR